MCIYNNKLGLLLISSHAPSQSATVDRKRNTGTCKELTYVWITLILAVINTSLTHCLEVLIIYMPNVYEKLDYFDLSMTCKKYEKQLWKIVYLLKYLCVKKECHLYTVSLVCSYISTLRHENPPSSIQFILTLEVRLVCNKRKLKRVCELFVSWVQKM